MEEIPTTAYPLSLSIDYPDGDRNRLTIFFRLFMLIPIWVVLALLSTSEFSGGGEEWDFYVGGGGVVAIPIVLMILFRQKYPKWWFNWNLELTRFSTRVFAYFALLRDEYPSTDEEQSVHLDIVYPDAKEDLNRWLPLVKWLLAILHYFVLIFLGIVSIVLIIIAWFAILFTGRYPKEMFGFVVGVERWSLRVGAYAFLLVTDKYPPFRLGE
ncbi:MAG: DUF4389 domain-containing protein [Chloroflexi bacterium]|nr:DUF4389 domain-containing protein [Chloroflexota bacterium]